MAIYEYDKIFGQRLRDLRIQNGDTQEQLGKEIKISRSNISMYENGETMPDYLLLIRISEYYSVSVDYLLGLQDKKTNDLNDICEKIGLSQAAVEKLQSFVANPILFSDDLLGLDYFIRFDNNQGALNALGKCIRNPEITASDLQSMDDLVVSSTYNGDSENYFVMYEGNTDEPVEKICKTELFQFILQREINRTIAEILKNKAVKSAALKKIKEKYIQSSSD